MSQVFLSCLDELQASRKAAYNPNSHPIVMEFSERVRSGEEVGEVEEGEEEGDEDLVVGQVDRSLKCPLTRVFLEDPVTSRVCKHSYSKSAIHQHIRQQERYVHVSASEGSGPVCYCFFALNLPDGRQQA